MLEIKRLKINVKESMSGINAYKAFSIDNFRINKTKGVYYVKGKKDYIDAFYDSLIGSSEFSFRRLFKRKNTEAVNLLLIDGKKNKLGKYLIEDTKSNREFFARQTVKVRLNYGKRVFDESKMILEEIGINYYSKIKELTNYQFLRLELLNASLKKPAVLLVNPSFLTDLSEEETKEIDSRIKKIGSDILVFYPSNNIIDENSNQIIINENSFLLKQDEGVEYYSKKDEEKSSGESAVLTRDKRLFKKKFILNFPKIAFTCSILIFTLSTIVLNLLINNNFALVINNPYQYSSIIFGGNLDYLSKLVEQKNVSFNTEIAEIMASDKQVNLPAKLETSAIKPRYSFDFNNFNYLTLPAAEMNKSYNYSTTYHDVFNPEENVYYDESTSSYFYFDRNVSQTDIDKVIDDLNIYPAAVIRNLPLAKFNLDTGNPDKFTFLDNFDLSNYLINGIKYDENSIKEALSAYYPVSSNYFVFVNGTDNDTKHFPSYLTMISGSVPNDSYGMVITDYKLELYKKFGFQYYENGELKTIPGDQVTPENILNKQIYLNDITTNSYGNYHTYWDKDYWNKFNSGSLGYEPDKELLNELISTSNLVELSKVYISGVCKFENENNDVEHFINYANDQLEGIVTVDSSSSAVSEQSISPSDLYGLARKRLSQNNEIWGSYYDSIYANFALNTLASPASAVYVNANSTFNKLYCGTAFSSEKTLYDFFKLGDTYNNLLSFFLCDRYKDSSEYLNLLSMSRFSHVYKSEDLLKNYKLCFYPVDVFNSYIFSSTYHHNSSYYQINKYISNNIKINTLLFDSKADVLYPILKNDFKTENKDFSRTFVSEAYFNDLDLSDFETYSVQYSFNNRQDLNWLKTALVALNCLIVVVLMFVYKPYKQSYQTVLKNNKYGIIKQGCSIALMLLLPILLAFGTSLLISFAQLGDYSFVLEAALPNYEGMRPTYQIGHAASLPIFTYNSAVFADILNGFSYSLIYTFVIPFALYIGVCLIARYFGKYIFQAYSKAKESVSHFLKKIVDNYLKD